MAAGDVYSVGPTSTANNGFLDLKPSAGTEIVVHNLYFADAVEIYFSDGTNNILIDSDASGGARLNLTHHCTNSKYVRIKNVSGGAQLLAADGIYTK